MPDRHHHAIVWVLFLSSNLATFGGAGEVANANIFLDSDVDYSEASAEPPVSARTSSRTKLFERKRNECLGLMLSISRKCKRTIRRKAQNDQCRTENECQDMYSTCHDRLRRRHFILERSCQKVTRGRVPLCEAETRFIAVQNNPQEPKFDERQLRIFERLSNITDPDLLSDLETPQGQAFNWIAREDGLELDVKNATLDQRYILATFYFATNGDGWDRCYRGAPEEHCRPQVGRPGIPQAPPETSLVRFRGNSSFCVGVNNPLPGENLILRECNMMDDHMLWYLYDDGLLRLRARSDRLDPLCAGATNRNNNRPVEIFSCEPSPNLMWRFNASGNFDFRLSDSSVCITTEDVSDPKSGDAITITQCDGNIDQRWDYDGQTIATSFVVPSFLSPLHECDWFGILNCLNGTHVDHISLNRNNLIGIVPRELHYLRHLDRLSLSSNHLAGQIKTYTFPSSLSVLDLRDNSLIGKIPRLHLPKLTELYLGSNKIVGGIDDLFNGLSRNASLIDLGNNRFAGEVPSVLSEFTSLIYLDMSGTFLNGTIPEVLCATEGERIYINIRSETCPNPIKCRCCRQNYCPTPPPTPAPTISQSPSISFAPTYDPQAFYDALANITNQATLEDSSTPQGAALHWLLREDGRHLQPDDPTLTQRYLMALLYFSFDGDNWHQCFAKAIPKDCGGRHYRESYQPFLSESSECFWGLWDGYSCDGDGLIRMIRIPRNNLVGNLPMELAALPELRHIDLSHNTINGILPQAWPPKLESLLLANNKISGSLIGEFPTSLHHLDLEGNVLNGTVEGLIVALNRTKVSFLNLRGNRLTGSIPATLADLSLRDIILRQANFANNQLAGSMPDAVCDAHRKGKIRSIVVDCPPDGVECSCCNNRCPPTPMPTTPMPTSSPTVSSAPSVSPAPSQSPSISNSPTSSPAPTKLPTSPAPTDARSFSFSISFSAPVLSNARRRTSLRAEDGNRKMLRKKHQAKRQRRTEAHDATL